MLVKLRLYLIKLARDAGIPKPKVGIAKIPIPNAFAFGRSTRDGRVCVTEGILKLLNGDWIPLNKNLKK